MDNMADFQTNLSIHGVDTKNRGLMNRPFTNLTCFQRGDFMLVYLQ